MRDGAFSYARLGQISVAGGAPDTGLIMRSMAEGDMGRRGKRVNALPGNLDVFVRVGDDLLNLWIAS